MYRLRPAALASASAVVALLTSPAPAAGQISVNADAAFDSAYVSRGLTVTNRFVIQPELIVNVPVGRGSLSLGAFANVEPVRYHGADHISESRGQAHHHLTELDLWAEYERELGSVTVGRAGYGYPNALPLVPQLAVYYDVGAA